MNSQESTVVVTGGCSGLGAATVAHFQSRGVNVASIDLAEPPSGSEGTLYLKGDVTSGDSVTSCFDQVMDRFAGIHVLVNCAGILGASRIVTRDGPHDLDLFKRVIEVNLIGTFNTLRLAAERMSANEPNDDGERGVIINTSSVSAYEGQIGQAAYSASKGGVSGMMLPIARDLARHGIRVVAIAPGVFRTPMMEAAPEAVVESLESQAVFPPRLGDPKEFALCVEQIVANPMYNGSTIRLDGAMRMQAR